MSDKERLEEIKEKYSEVTVLEYINNVEIVGVDIKDLVWLIEQAEKVEQLQRENEKEQKRLQNQIYETVEEKFLLEKQLQQAKAKAERYKHALKFYASGNHYSDKLYDYKIILLDDGEKARKALEESK